MCQVNTIKIISQIPSHWNLLFVSVSILGFYISLVLAWAKSMRFQHKLQLALYTTLLSILLLSITRVPGSMQTLSALLPCCGMLALYMIGPVSYQVFTVIRKVWKRLTTLLSFLPVPLSGILFGVVGSPDPWLYAGGIFYTGSWLILQSITVYRERISDEQLLHLPKGLMSSWNQRHTLIQLLLFAAICISLATDIARMLVAGIVSFLILAIWLRMLYTAYTTYSMNNP